MDLNSATTDGSGRAAAACFGALLPVAAVVYLVAGRHQWFFLDEWDFLAARTAGNLGDLFRAHNEHWSTLPILLYRALWQLVGLRHYRAYQVWSIAAHLATALLLRAVMRRCGVHPWLATAAASLFLFLGSGDQDVIWAFQVGYVGAVAFGFGQLLLATHDGPLDRRDGYALACGVGGLLSSGVAVPMVVAVGVAVLLTRGWRLAVLHTAPLAVIYLTWLLAIGRRGYEDHHTTLGEFTAFLRDGTTATFRAMGQITVVAIALAVLLVAGWVLAFTNGRVARDRARVGLVAGLVCGAVVYFVLGAIGRPRLTFGHESGRYMHVGAALLLPALAVAADTLVRRWRMLLAVTMLVFVAGIPGNLRDLREHGFVDQGDPGFMLSLPRVSVAREVAPSLHPDPLLAREVTVGWLRRGVAEGRIPPPPGRNARDAVSATLGIALLQTSGTVHGPCRVLTAPVHRRLAAGTQLGLAGGPLDVSVPQDAPTLRRAYSPRAGRVLVVRATLAVVLQSHDRRRPARLCG
jgi:hypothetical protein